MAKPIRVNGKTPNGGAYSEAYYLDAERKPAEPENASFIMINECREDGTVIATTYATAE